MKLVSNLPINRFHNRGKHNRCATGLAKSTSAEQTTFESAGNRVTTMKSIINLMAVVGDQATLIITHGHSTAHYLEAATGASTFVLPNDVLQRCSVRETNELQAAVERSHCTQLIFFSLLDEKMRSRLLYSSAMYSIRKSLQFKTKWLPESCELMPRHIATRSIMEKYIVEQCDSLMQYYFIQKRVEQRLLTVRGMLGVPHEVTPTTVFCNGVRFDDHVSMN